MIMNDVKIIYAEAIKEWIAKNLAPLCPPESFISVIHRPWHCKGESAFFASIEVYEEITLEELRSREVVEHSRAHYLHFNIDDVISAAVALGDIDGDVFHVHYSW